MAVPSCYTRGETVAYYALRIFVGLVLLFLIAPILAVMPLSFNSESFFTYPMPGYSLKWYQDFFFNPRWTDAVKMSLIVGLATTVLATVRGVGLQDAAFGALVAAFPNSGFMGVPLLVAMMGPAAAGPVICTVLADMVVTSTLCVGLSLSPHATFSSNSAGVKTVPAPLPPSVKLGRMKSGKRPISAAMAWASARLRAMPL